MCPQVDQSRIFGMEPIAVSNPRIHPTAIIGPEVELAPDVTVGPFTVMEGRVKIGAGSVIDTHVTIYGPVTMGERNHVGVGSVIGGEPQYRAFKNEVTSVLIGNDNKIREYVTINKGTADGGGVTSVGDHNYLMTGAHVAHDCHVHNHCTIINFASLAGHVELFNNCLVSGYVGIQQRSRVGRLAMLGGHSRVTRDVPPFVMTVDQNTVSGLNVIGMRRAGIARSSIDAIRQVFKILYLQGNTIPNALSEAEQKFPEVPEVKEFIAFCRASKFGICRAKSISQITED